MSRQPLPRPRTRRFTGFLSQSLRNFRQTGSVLPSSRVLGRAMTRRLPAGRPIRVLEVGAGSGAFSVYIIRAAGRGSEVDLVEINGELVSLLRRRLGDLDDSVLKNRKVRVHCGDIRAFEGKELYDAIICGLPFTNFRPEAVEELLQLMLRLLRPGGELTFFEYTMLRPVMMRRPGRDGARLREVQRVMAAFGSRYQTSREVVLRNFPPATVVRLRSGTPCELET